MFAEEFVFLSFSRLLMGTNLNAVGHKTHQIITFGKGVAQPFAAGYVFDERPLKHAISKVFAAESFNLRRFVFT